MSTTKILSSVFFSGIVLISTYKMANIIFPYTTWKWDVDFLLTKQFIIHLDHYRLAFYSHIFSSLIVLLAGVFLFSPYILKYCSKFHKIFGKVYVALILLVSAPSGMVMAYYANGGFWVMISFLILTSLWWFFTFKGFTSIRKRKVREHKIWMIRSYALTLSAISLRGYQFLFGYMDLVDPSVQYLYVSWTSWLGNMLVAELYILYSKMPFKSITSPSF